MTRATRFATKFAVVALAYLLFWLHVLPVPLVEQTTADAVLAALPWWALIAVGSHLMYELGKGLYYFNDTPKAYEELLVVCLAPLHLCCLSLTARLLLRATTPGNQRGEGLPPPTRRRRRLLTLLRHPICYERNAQSCKSRCTPIQLLGYGCVRRHYPLRPRPAE